MTPKNNDFKMKSDFRKGFMAVVNVLVFSALIGVGTASMMNYDVPNWALMSLACLGLAWVFCRGSV